ncbi:MAG: hypothetical protein JXB85_10770 [Anaerolineales bacterium]|nr:hypothetical protein [Anaerolineales bacterium]
MAFYIHPDDSRDELRYQAGELFFIDQRMVAVPQPYRRTHPEPPVAVLTNELTSSAGELVAIALRARPNTCSFGQRTNGLATAPQGFVLSDNAVIAVTASYFADREGQIYPDGVVPGQVILRRGDPLLRDLDVPQETLDWLLAQTACAGP